MDEQHPEHRPLRYEETTHPNNPPNSVLSVPARRAVVWSYFVPIVVLFAVVGVALLYWANRPAHSGAESTERPEVGTVGSAQGGFDPKPRPGSTRDEIERRGGDLAPMTSLGDLRDVDARSMVGRRVALTDVRVDSVQGSTFWVRDDDAKYPVVAEGAPSVRAGSKVNLTGHVESDGASGVRIRADHVEAQ